ncbi:MAG: magnesium transporter [Ruminococcaceae bacterium]|nr:magnesium transporter [Oscillospiraceae bacterium]
MYENALELLKEKRYPELRTMLMEMEAPDIALLLEEAEMEVVPRIYRILPKELAAETFTEMDADMQEMLIRSFSDNELGEVLEEMFLDDMADLVDEMPSSLVTRILRVTSSDNRKIINELLNYPEDSAGSIMTIEFVDFKKHITVKEAFDILRKTAPDKETVYTCYVTDARRHLIGVVTVKDLLLAPYDEIIENIMDTGVIYNYTHDDKEEVARDIEKYGFLAMPIVDNETRLVGIVTVDDAIEVISEEAEEDFAIMAAVTPSEETYFKTSIWGHSKNRILWLLILMLSSTFTGMIITNYETAMNALLVSFIPMIMGTGGNSGSQSSAMIVRGLATEEIKLKDFMRVFIKELCIGVFVGVVLAVVNALRTWLMYELMYKNDPVYAEYNIWMVSLTVGLTIIGVVVLAKILGAVLPMLAKRLNLDPAIMASPLITTIVDTCAVLLYFNIAIAVLSI